MADFRVRVGFENFDEMPRIDLEIKSEQGAVLEKVEMLFQSERAAIKVQTPVQIF